MNFIKNFSFNFEGEPNQKFLLNKNIYKKLEDENYAVNKKDFAKNIASSAQKIFEEALFKIINQYKGKNENLVLSGGCALNSLANGKLSESKIFKNVFVPFCPGDNGGSIGAALYLLKKSYPKIKTENLQNPYLGKKYNKNEIKNALDIFKSKIEYKLIDDDNELNNLVCKYLIEEKLLDGFKTEWNLVLELLEIIQLFQVQLDQILKTLLTLKLNLEKTLDHLLHPS